MILSFHKSINTIFRINFTAVYLLIISNLALSHILHNICRCNECLNKRLNINSICHIYVTIVRIKLGLQDEKIFTYSSRF